jgi:hypothetical protein
VAKNPVNRILKISGLSEMKDMFLGKVKRPVEHQEEYYNQDYQNDGEQPMISAKTFNRRCKGGKSENSGEDASGVPACPLPVRAAEM